MFLSSVNSAWCQAGGGNDAEKAAGKKGRSQVWNRSVKKIDKGLELGGDIERESMREWEWETRS
jgi:hypothetical protein